MTMYTRLATWTNATNIDGGIEFLRSTAVALFRQQQGYRGLTATVDRSNGTIHVLSVWESEADRDASASAIDKARDEASEIIGGTLRVERLEDLASVIATRPTPGCALMVTPYRMDPSSIEENLAFFNEELVPQIQAIPGFCAVRNMVDRSTGEGYVGTIWADRATLDQQAQGAAASRREAASARGITFGEIGLLEFVLVDNP
jgi:quinol monooxygenase YgiN